MREIYPRTGNIQLHGLEGGEASADRVPLLIIPGLAEPAAEYADLMMHLAPRRCIAITLRGRAGSAAPETGYTLEDHVADVETAAARLAARRFCLFAFSRGVAYALGYALGHRLRCAGLILGDYPASHSALPPEFPDRFLATTWRGKPAAECIAPHALRALQRESRAVSFWERLGEIECPALVIHGAVEHGAMLSDANLRRYRDHLPSARFIRLAASGHDLRAPDPAPFYEAIASFLQLLDAGAQANPV